MTALSPQGAYALSLDTVAHDALRRVLRVDDVVVDATAGNGYDTLFLAQTLGPQGVVWAFDVQQQALDATRVRVDAARAEAAPPPFATVRCVLDSHENAPAHLPPQELGAVVFNLGYLPRADKRLTTTAATTLAALRALMPRVRAGGLVSLHVYTGHAGGAEEQAALADFTAALPYTEWSVLHSTTRNKRLRAEHLYLLLRHVGVGSTVGGQHGESGQTP